MVYQANVRSLIVRSNLAEAYLSDKVRLTLLSCKKIISVAFACFAIFSAFAESLFKDAEGFEITTGGYVNWEIEDLGRNLAWTTFRSGNIGVGRPSNTYMEMSVVGPTYLVFKWKVSCSTGRYSGGDYSRLSCSVASTFLSISGEKDWSFECVLIPEGIHTVRWEYHCDGEDYGRFENRGWVTHIGTANWVASADFDGIYTLRGLEGTQFGHVSQLLHGNISLPRTVDGKTVRRIGMHAISGCSGLTAVTIPDGVTSIADYAFSNCNGLTSVAFPEGCKSLGDYAFENCSGLTSVWMPEGVTNIGEYAFVSCSGLSFAPIPFGVTVIKRGVFAGCSGLTSVVIPEGVTNIGEYAFSGCSGLTAVTIPEGCERINYDAFAGCKSLPRVEIPSTMKYFGWGVFEGCDNLMYVMIPPSIESTALSTITRALDGCNGLRVIEVDTSNQKCQTVNNLLLDRDGKTVIAGVNGNIFIPEGVSNIGEYSFCGRGNLTSVLIPSSVTNIAYGAFEDCSGLTSVSIPESVMHIERNAFTGCSMLGSGLVIVSNCVLNCDETLTTHVALPEGVRLMADGVFSGSQLISVEIPSSLVLVSDEAFEYCSELRGVTIAAGVKEIGMSSFAYCSGLSSLTIPPSVTNIRAHAFLGCDNLKRVLVHQGDVERVKGLYNWADTVKFVTDPDEPYPDGEYEGVFDGYVVNFSVKNGGAKIQIVEGAGRACVQIPESLGNYPVVSIGDMAFAGLVDVEK